MPTLPRLRGVIERRILLNFAVDPGRVEPLLPAGFRPQLVGGRAIAGACLIRLGNLRPAGLPAWVGLRSENAALRVAVLRDGPDGPEPGVWVPERMTGSRLVAWGDRLFPAGQRQARFDVREGGGRYRVDVGGRVSVDASESDALEPGSVFADHAEASAFFRDAPVGHSPGPGGRPTGIRLCVDDWASRPLRVDRATVRCGLSGLELTADEYDHALLMTDVPHEWRAV